MLIKFLKGMWVPAICLLLFLPLMGTLHSKPVKKLIQYNFSFNPPEGLTKVATAEGAKKGEELFNNNCSACHGLKGIGEDPKQPMGFANAQGLILAPALDMSGHAPSHAVKGLFFRAKYGGTRSDTRMIGFGDHLSDKEIVQIIQYVQSLWTEGPHKKHNPLFP